MACVLAVEDFICPRAEGQASAYGSSRAASVEVAFLADCPILPSVSLRCSMENQLSHPNVTHRLFSTGYKVNALMRRHGRPLPCPKKWPLHGIQLNRDTGSLSMGKLAKCGAIARSSVRAEAL